MYYTQIVIAVIINNNKLWIVIQSNNTQYTHSFLLKLIIKQGIQTGIIDTRLTQGLYIFMCIV